MEKYLTEEIFKKLCVEATATGFTLNDAIRSGKVNLDSSVGVYCGDAESYTLFAPLLDPVVTDYHDREPGQNKQCILRAVSLDHPDPEGKYIISSRVRVARNLTGFAFPNHMDLASRLDLEAKVGHILQLQEGDLRGCYSSYDRLSDEEFNQLRAEKLIFGKGDRFQEAAGFNRDFPKGRGAFHSDDKCFRVWVNEEDHLRIISQQPGGDIAAVFNRFISGIEVLEKQMTFAWNDRYGYLTSCPSNIGTSMRAGVHIRLKKLAEKRELLDSLVDTYKLQIRGTGGEKTAVDDGVFDLSNRQRFGLTEGEIIHGLHKGILAVIAAEKSV